MTSLSFLVHLKDVKVYHDEYLLAHVTKTERIFGDHVPIPTALRVVTPEETMRISGIKKKSE